MQLVMMLYTASTWVLPVLLAVTLHEAAHGFVAYQLGDDTAYRLGRVTFNPLKHIDPFGTILMPAILLLLRAPFLFGYAKPVPVNFRALNHPRRDMVLVAAAGPGMNIALATLAALLFHITYYLPQGVGSWVAQNLQNALIINVVLAVFNMLPLPPLDGGREYPQRRCARNRQAMRGASSTGALMACALRDWLTMARRKVCRADRPSRI